MRRVKLTPCKDEDYVVVEESQPGKATRERIVQASVAKATYTADNNTVVTWGHVS